MARKPQPRTPAPLPAPFPVDQLVPLRLCTARNSRLLARRITQIYERALAPLGLSIAQFGMLAQIAGSPDIEQSTLARRMGLDASTLSRNLRAVLAQGLIEETVSPDDRRRRRLSLTRDGQAVLRDALPLWKEAQDRVTAQIDPAALRALAKASDAFAES